ncbi:MAG: hypothetical protein AB1397_07635 [bacterium]
MNEDYNNLLEEIKTSSCPNCKRLLRIIEEQQRIIEKQQIMIKELERKVKELERRLNKYENAHTPPSEKKFFDPPSNQPHKTPGRPIGHSGTTRPVPIPNFILT